MARIKPSVRSTETYTESNFLRLQTQASRHGQQRTVTIEHLCYRDSSAEAPSWVCQTIVDGEAMSKEDALFIAKAYAVQNEIPVIYECHDE